MEFRAVTVGLKVISSPFFISALLFFSIRLWVRVRWSFLGWSGILYLSSVNPMISRAREVQWWGFVRPSIRSWVQFGHSQSRLGAWLLSILLSLQLIRSRSFM